MTNRFGLDVDYFKIELNQLLRSLDNRTPEELYNYLIRLADIVEDKYRGKVN